MFNSNPVIQTFSIDDEQVCYVIDEVLRKPEQWLEQALAHRALFREQAGNAYPGLELPMPENIEQSVLEFVTAYLGRRFHVRRLRSVSCRLAMVGKSPEALQPRQWICHRDRLKIHPDERAIASVLYLFDNPELGGTQFFRPKRDASAIDRLVHDSSTMSADAFSAQYGFQAGYMTDSNDWFEKTMSVPARWNRMIVYDGMVFHSGDIRRPELMSADPCAGRLCLNGFFSGRRSLA
jgi:hypothetical protein